MPCNCRECDCQDKRFCFLIENRLNTLACIFDKVADGYLQPDNGYGDQIGSNAFTEILSNFLQPFYNYDIALYPACKYRKVTDVSEFGINEAALFDYYKISGNDGLGSAEISMFEDLTGFLPSNFIPSGEVTNIGDKFLNGVSCIPFPSANGACYTCKPLPLPVKAICAISSDVSDLSNYSAIAQNLRYAATLFGCE
jgi:hypothetical protein